MTTFQEIGVSPELLKGIEKLNFTNPMPIQEEVIPKLLKSDRDILGFAQTGTGKTAAFGLPIIQLTDLSTRKTQALILSPTRELGLQIARDLRQYAKYIKNLKIVNVYGGADISRQIKSLKDGAHIIVATPGRMKDLLDRGKIIDMSHLRTVVLDEADEMLSMGFKDELDSILDATPNEKSMLLFSATMSKEVKKLARNYMIDPLEISVGQRNVGAENVEHVSYPVQERNRYEALKRIVDFHPNMYGIIFCRTREETRTVAKKLMQDGYNADALHGDLSQPQREAVMHKFRIKNLHLLTATDVAARGLDVKDISHIINYNLPDEETTYIHRSGRTGRAGHKGVSIAIINMREKYKIARIESMLKKKFEVRAVPDGKAICQKQVLKIVDNMQEVDIDHEEIEQFLPAVYEKLAHLDREEIIKHFVAMEFNHFLDYYKNAEDLKTPPEKESRRSNKPQKRERPQSHRRRPRGAEEGYTRFYINIGQRDKISPPDLIGLINRSTKQRNIGIGKIDIMKKFSFFDADEYYTNEILSGFKNITYNKQNVVVEVTKSEPEPETEAPKNKWKKTKSRRRR